MNAPRLRNSLSMMTTGLVLMNTAWAGIPVWTFAPVSGSPASVSVSPSTTTTIKYTVTNQSHKSHTLKMTPIQGIASSGCTSPLGYYQSCTLTLAVAGSGLTGDVFGGPILCDQGNPNQCYQPSSADQLRITLLKNSPVIRNTVATGYYNSSGTQYPMLAQSTDNGVSWSYKIDKIAATLPVDYDNFGTFDSSSCTGTTCTATGYYYSSGTQYPMLAQSTDNGVTWSYKIDKTSGTLPMDYASNGSFTSTSCTGTTCTAVGYYSHVSNINYPMLAQSTDNGVSWTYKIDKTPGTLPVDYASNGIFNSTSCTGTTCTAAGTYSDVSNIRYPMLAQSTDNGVSWTYKIDKTPGSLPVDYDNFGYFNSTSCTGTTCTAAGAYVDSSSTQYPILAQSTDNGVSWSYKIDKTPGTLPIDFFSNGYFNSTSCTGTTCTAAGTYSDGSTPQSPMLAQSTDNGVSWSYKIDQITGPLPVDFGNFGTFTSTSCTSTSCTAAGYYSSSNITYPMLAQSTDNGVSWSYKIDKTAATLPVDFSSGTFNSTSATNTLLKSLSVVNPEFERGAPRPPFRILD